MKKLIAAALAAALLLSGCGAGQRGVLSNYREVEHLQPVQTLGMDASDIGVRLTVSCPKPSAQSPGSIISREGSGIIHALSSLQNYAAEQELYYAHAQYLLLGEDYAREKAGEALDFVARDTQLRLGLGLFVVRGEAKELISGPGEESYEISRTLSSIRRDTEAQGLSHVFSCRETIRKLSEQGAALVCAISAADTGDSVFLSESGLTAVPLGYGILRGDGLVGWIEPDVSQAANLLMGHLGSAGPILPDGEGGSLSFEYSRGRVKIRPLGRDALRIEAEITASLAEPDTAREHISDSDFLRGLEQALAEDMEGKIMEVLSLSRELDADFLGLGGYLKEKSPDWPASAEFELSCSAKIDYSRELADKMGTSGGGN